MDDKYLPDTQTRQQIVITQIGECQTLIYRNELENLTFKEKKDQDKQTEVETNNGILKRKLDLLFKELEKLYAEDQIGSRNAEPGPSVQPNPR